MTDKKELRKHRCCFSGHRPEKLNASEDEVKEWLKIKILEAYKDGYRTFITGMAMGVDCWAGYIVIELKETYPDIHLIAATPWPGFASKWREPWKSMYSTLWANADYQKVISSHYFNGVFQVRNEWMVNHSNRVIAFYNGSPGGTRNTIDYAVKNGIQVVSYQEEY